MQQLILPLNDCKLTASYKNALYKKAYGYEHFGCDYAGGREIIASGTGIVWQVGFDKTLGNIVVVIYPLCKLHDNSVKSLSLRYCHLDKIEVNRGQVVVRGEILGRTGQTPKGKINGVHLHIEVDSDTDFPLFTPTIAVNSNILKAGYRGEKDSTFSPTKAFYLGSGQRIYRAQPLDPWTTDEDVQLPLAGEPSSKDNCRILIEIVRLLARVMV